MFLKADQGQYALHISPIVIAECVYVLQASPYRYSRGIIATKLMTLVNHKAIKVKEKTIILESLQHLAYKEVDFPDVYIAALARNIAPHHVLTWNINDFKKTGVPVNRPNEI